MKGLIGANVTFFDKELIPALKSETDLDSTIGGWISYKFHYGVNRKFFQYAEPAKIAKPYEGHIITEPERMFYKIAPYGFLISLVAFVVAVGFWVASLISH